MTFNKCYAERLIQLFRIQAKNFGEMERNMVAIARALECLFDIDTEAIVESKHAKDAMIDTADKPAFMDPHNPKVSLESLAGATAAISGKTMTVISDDPLGAKLIKRFPDGKELWCMPCTAGSTLSVAADNKWMVTHPGDETEELMERLQEDHGV